jgi:hypothetical protein
MLESGVRSQESPSHSFRIYEAPSSWILSLVFDPGLHTLDLKALARVCFLAPEISPNSGLGYAPLR